MNKPSGSADEAVIESEGGDAVGGEREDESRADHGVACLLHQDHPVVLLRLLHHQLWCSSHLGLACIEWLGMVRSSGRRGRSGGGGGGAGGDGDGVCGVWRSKEGLERGSAAGGGEAEEAAADEAEAEGGDALGAGGAVGACGEGADGGVAEREGGEAGDEEEGLVDGGRLGRGDALAGGRGEEGEDGGEGGADVTGRLGELEEGGYAVEEGV